MQTAGVGNQFLKFWNLIRQSHCSSESEFALGADFQEPESLSKPHKMATQSI